MFISYTWTTCLLGFAVACVIFLLVRRNLLHASYALWWSLVGTAVVAAGVFPQVLDAIGIALGVSYPPILFVVIGLLVLLVRLLLGDIARTRMEIQLRYLAQKSAMFHHRLAQLEKRLPPAGESRSAGKKEDASSDAGKGKAGRSASSAD